MIHYFDAHLVNDDGEGVEIKNAVCMHEEDAGLAWKHTDWRSGNKKIHSVTHLINIPYQYTLSMHSINKPYTTLSTHPVDPPNHTTLSTQLSHTGKSQVRRTRRLVVSFMTTIANYDYGFAYHLYPDGTIESAIKLTGALSTGVFSFEEQVPLLSYILCPPFLITFDIPPLSHQCIPSSSPNHPGLLVPFIYPHLTIFSPWPTCYKQATGRKYGTSLGGSLYAPVHQHFFVSRMDFCLDGTKNCVVEMNAQRDDEINEEDNPSLNAFFYKQTVLKTEQQAIRDCCPESARFWKVISSDKTNAIGQPTAYKIVPGPKIRPFAPLERAANLKRAAFLDHQLWVTPFCATEKYPGIPFISNISYPHILCQSTFLICYTRSSSIYQPHQSTLSKTHPHTIYRTRWRLSQSKL